MTETALAGTALANLQGNTDEAKFAGLLLLTKCSRSTLAAHASKATTLLLSGGGFLKRLLLSKPAAEVDETQAPLLSHMQTLGLHVTSALGQAGGDGVRRQLASELGPSVIGLAASLLDSGATVALASSLPDNSPQPAPSTGSDAGAVFADIFECLHSLFVGLASGRSHQSLPSTLVPTLVRFLRCCPPDDASPHAPSSLAARELTDDDDAIPKAPQPSSARCSNLALALVAHALEQPLRQWGSSATAVASFEAVASLCDGVGVAVVDRRGNWTPSNTASTPVGGAAATTTTPTSEAQEEEGSASEGAPQVSLGLSLLLHWCCAHLNQPSILDPATKTALEAGPFAASLRRGLMIGLHGGASESLRDSALQLIAVAFQALGGRWAIEGEASSTPKGSALCLFLSLASGEYRLLIDEALALHSHRVDEATGGRSTTAEDLDNDHEEAPPDLESTYQSPRWRPSNNHNELNDHRRLSPDPAPPTLATTCAHCGAPGAKQVCSGCRRAAYCGPACQRLAWTTGNHREACSNIREVASAAAVAKALDHMPEAQRTSRESRVRRMVPICVRIVELCIGFLCEGGDDDDDDEGNSFSQVANDAFTSGWTSLPPDALLALQQTLVDVMRSSIELLQDARAATNNSNTASRSNSKLTDALLSRPCDRVLRAVVIECGRCLACWLAQESGALRDELANAKALDFLLQMSTYARPSPSNSVGAINDAVASSNVPSSSWADRDDNSVDSDDEVPIEEGKVLDSKQGGAASSSQSLQLPRANERDVLVFLLPALTALCHEDEGGPLAIVNCGAVPVLASFVTRELESSFSRKEAEVEEEGLPTGNEEMLTSVIMAKGLLFDLVASCATEIVSIDGFEGQLVDLPCFATILPCLVRFSSQVQPLVAPSIGSSSDDDASSLLRAAFHHAVALFLLVERHCQASAPLLEASPQLKRAAKAIVADFLGSVELSTGEEGVNQDPMLHLARSLALQWRS